MPRLVGDTPVRLADGFTVITPTTVNDPPSVFVTVRSRGPGVAPTSTSIWPRMEAPDTAARPGFTVIPLPSPNDTIGWRPKPDPAITNETDVAPFPTKVRPGTSASETDVNVGPFTIETRSSVLVIDAPPSSFVRMILLAPVGAAASTDTVAVRLVELLTITDDTRMNADG
jgi:hypothetical protein